jgi:hypothetical protein
LRENTTYYREKSKTAAGNIAAEENQKIVFERMRQRHQRLALEAFFTEDQLTFLEFDKHFRFSDENLPRIGIAQRSNVGKPQFIHRTFAEYFVAEFLIEQLTKESKQHKQGQDMLLNKF